MGPTARTSSKESNHEHLSADRLDAARTGPDVEQISLLTDQLFDLLIEIGERDEQHCAMAIALRDQDAA